MKIFAWGFSWNIHRVEIKIAIECSKLCKTCFISILSFFFLIYLCTLIFWSSWYKWVILLKWWTELYLNMVCSIDIIFLGFIWSWKEMIVIDLISTCNLVTISRFHFYCYFIFKRHTCLELCLFFCGCHSVIINGL